MKTGIWITLSVLAVLALILHLAAPRMAFKFLFGKPSRSKKIPAYYVGTPHYKASQKGLALMRTLPSEEVTITSRDGLKLHGYLFPAEGEYKKFVIGVHGYQSYSRPEFAPYIAFYLSLGFGMLMVDNRAHAPSEGDYIGFGVLDRLDCVDWANYLTDTYGSDVQILLHGVSMGGATVLAAAGEEDLPEQVIGVISDCGFSDPESILRYQFRHAHVPVGLVRRVEKICAKKAGYNFRDYSALKAVRRTKVPVLFVHGEEDTMVPPRMSQELYDACNPPKRLMKVPGAGHGESIAIATQDYYQQVREFFGI